MDGKIFESCACYLKRFSRRRFFSLVGWGAIAGFTGTGGYSTFKFLKPGVLYEPAENFLAGSLDDYTAGAVSEKWKESQKIWMVRKKEGIYALVSICTHLACTPNWFESEGLFKCPCHGSVFNMDGDVLRGPAPEPLYRAPVSLTSDGQLVVGTGLLGIRQLGQANREPLRSSSRFLLRA